MWVGGRYVWWGKGRGESLVDSGMAGGFCHILGIAGEHCGIAKFSVIALEGDGRWSP